MCVLMCVLMYMQVAASIGYVARTRYVYPHAPSPCVHVR